MGSIILEQISSVPLQKINVEGGDVLHAFKPESDTPFSLGEAYFSFIEADFIKAWKFHKKMTLNLIVPLGEVRFVFTDGQGSFRQEVIGENNYARLTVPPCIWFGFQGTGSKRNIILNLANMAHSEDEVERKALDSFNFDWNNLI